MPDGDGTNDGQQGKPAGDSGQGNPPAGEQQGAGALGPEGEKALEAWKQRARTAEAEAKRAKELDGELARLREQTMSDQEKAIEKAKREATAEANKTFNSRLVQAEVRAAAAGKLADPEDAIRFIDLSGIAIDGDGAVDKKAIEKELTDLLKARPYLAASATRPTGTVDQGARGGAGDGGDMNALIRGAFGRR